MKKLYSLIKACMTSDMNIFKIKKAKGKKSASKGLIIFVALCLMFSIWANAQILFEKMAPMHLEHIVLSIAIFAISFLTIIEGTYKTGSLLFNCKDDQLLLSLPIERRTVLFIRIFKFYVFELVFNSLFMIPVIIAYMRWAPVDFNFFLTNFIMLFMIPIIPIVISCIIGAIVSGLASRFRHKNTIQIIISVLFAMGFFYIYFNMEGFYEYIVNNATSLNDLIMKFYYPAGMYAKLITDFNIVDLLVFVLVNITIFSITIFILSKVYFKINSRLKKVSTNSKKVSIDKLTIKSSSATKSLIKKELNTFFQTPVFIVNSGFSLILFLIGTIIISLKFDSIMAGITDPNGMDISADLILNNMPLVILTLISLAAYMTSITNSVISLEGRNINILKSLPISTKTILMSKIYSCLLITTPVLLIGNILLFIRFKIGIIDSILLLILSILIPLVSHFIGLIINLKYPKFDFENATEVVKQSTSSIVSVMIGMVLFIISISAILKLAGILNATLVLLISIVIHLIIDLLLYTYLMKKGIKEFNSLSI